MALSEQDLQWMRRAIRLAQRGYPAPNPHVGAVVVKDGALVGEGFHPYAGAAHAEVYALQQAGAHAQGATLYVTLEPCCHHGRTPPCTDAVRDARIARVVVGMLDPNPEVNGRGVEQLREAGLQIELLNPDIPAEAKLIRALEAVNRIYLYWRRHNRPYITLKAAMSLDGKIATHTGDSKWITGARARREAHRLRAEHRAVLVGVETVIRDRPHLTARLPGVVNQPLRVVLDAQVRLWRWHRKPHEQPIFDTEEARTILFYKGLPYYPDGKELHKSARWISELGVHTEPIYSDFDDPYRVDVRQVVDYLWHIRNIPSILVEGGGQVSASFVEAKLANRIAYFYAPKLIGGANARTALEGTGVSEVARAVQVVNITQRRFGGDWLIEGDLVYPD
ncbi:MAG: bifunctional diaminohydroxyphosphoribosylaminopyrimidine deaminase/5-amino-6-(5-phosphoribosylamino)uracil reductase RibD [Fimbriimonadales bacterium]|nr:MAG: riboflavin biosynthesis protein RibD [Fimbriimonadales bacterium]